MSLPARPYLTRMSQFAWIASFWFVIHFIWATLLPVVIPAMVKGMVAYEDQGTRLGLLLGAGAAVSAVLQLTIGFVSDSSESRFGRRKPYIVIGVLLSCAAMLYLVHAPGYWQLLIAYFFAQLFINTASVPYQSMMPDLVPERYHGRAAAMMGLFDLTGKLSGLMVVGLVLAGVGMGATRVAANGQPSFAVLGLVYCVLLLALAAVVLSKAPSYPSTLAAGFLRFRLAQSGGRSVLREFANFGFRANWELVKLMFSRTAILLGYYTFIPFVYYFVESNLHVPEERIWLAAVLLAAIILGAVAGNLTGGYFCDRVGKRRVIFMGMAVTIVFMLPMIFARDIITAIAYGIGLGAGWGAFIAADWAFAFTLIPKEKTARYMGVWDMTALAPQMVAPMAAGFARDRLLGLPGGEATAYQLIFSFAIIYFIIGLVILGYVREKPISREDDNIHADTQGGDRENASARDDGSEEAAAQRTCPRRDEKWACDVLGVPFSAPSEKIKSAYRFLAGMWHMDHGYAGDDDRMKDINQAYDILKRARSIE